MVELRAYTERLRDLVARITVGHHVNLGDEAATQADKTAMIEWLRQSPLHVSEYLDFIASEDALTAAAKRIDTPLEQLISEARADADVLSFPHASDFAGTAHPATGSPSSNRSLRRLAIAGLAACLIAAVTVGVLWNGRTESSEFVTAHGEQRVWQLPDHTVVHLDSSTKITVKFNRNSRAISLVYGRAFFEVGKDPARPFHVEVGTTVLQDVGTSFDVFRTNGHTVVTVADGQIFLLMPNGMKKYSRAADIRAGDQATIKPSGDVKIRHQVDVDLATAWTRQEIIFKQEAIEDVAAEFNRYNQRQILIDAPGIAKYRISGLFHSFDVESFITFLNGLPGVHVTNSGDAIHVVAVPRPSNRKL